MNAPKFWSPLHLSDTVGTLNSIGDDLTVNPQKLLNPNRGPMLIDQFRFSGRNLTYLPGLAVIAAEIRFGSIPLMAKPVTLGAFAPRYTGAAGNGIDSAILANGTPSYDTTLVWHLAKPLFVPQNVQVTVRLIRQRLFAPGTLTEPVTTIPSVRVSVVGRSLAEKEPNPDSIWVPWVAETKAQVASNQFSSGDADLINNHDTPLNVKAFTAVSYSTGSGTPYPASNLLVQMTGSNGTAIIRDPTPFGLLFPVDRGLLEVDANLQPGEYMRARLEIPSVPPGAVAADSQVQFTSIGMVGYRRVPCPKANVR